MVHRESKLCLKKDCWKSSCKLEVILPLFTPNKLMLSLSKQAATITTRNQPPVKDTAYKWVILLVNSKFL